MSLMVSISGIRGVVGETLTPDVVVRYVSAYAEYCGRGPVVLGRDGRITGASIANLAAAALLQMGCEVRSIGICPTPTVQLAVEKFKAAGGIAVTASHNPMQWNGLKFMASTGMFLNGEENAKFWEIAGRSERKYVPWDKQGTRHSDSSLIDDHIAGVLRLPYLRIEEIRRKRFRIVLDCVNAAGGVIVPRLLKDLGCDVVEMNCDVSGVFSHTPEPLPENLTSLAQRVVAEKADLGIAVDPDVDRLVLITETGAPFVEEYTVTAAVKFVLEAERRLGHSGHTVTVNLSTTRAVDDVAKEYGARVVRTPVGEINVASAMKRNGSIVGGEGSGGVILPALHLGRDAIVGIGLVLQLLTDSGETMSGLKSRLPNYVIVKSKVGTGGLNPESILSRLQTTYRSKGTMNTDDGLKIDFPQSWVHLRKSNTEPIIRIIAEARTREEAASLVDQFRRDALS